MTTNGVVTKGILGKITQERKRQLQLWGKQNHDNGTNPIWFKEQLDKARYVNTVAGANPSWAGILLEEVYEALVETDTEKIQEELIQAGAVIIAWLESLTEASQTPGQ